MPPAGGMPMLGAIAAFLVLVSIWIALEGSLDEEDLIAAPIAASVAVSVGFLLIRRGTVLPRLRLADASRLARTPAQLVRESIQVLALAARKALGAELPASAWVKVPVALEDSGGRAAGRDALLTVLMSLTPNDIVADLDPDTGVALVHRLLPREAGATTTTAAGPGDRRSDSEAPPMADRR
jgi:multisubunit Na+/H+ antiporter MnhE subunit